MSLPFFTGDFGVAPALEAVIGRPDQNQVARWGPLIRNGSRTGQEFNRVWSKIIDDGKERADFVNEELGGTILGQDSPSAGDNSVDGSTRTKTTQLLESLHFRSVLEGLKSHPNQNQKPVKRFRQLDKCSQAWLSALCSPLSAIPSPEFTEAMAFKFYVPSPACAPFVGQMVAGKPLDKHREVLLYAMLHFDSWRLYHNSIQSTIKVMNNQ